MWSALKGPSKRLRALQQLQAAQLRAYIFNAIDGDMIQTQSDLSDIGARVMPGYVGSCMHHMPLTTGEAGCFLSHWGIYEKMARENIPCALIFEDDFDIVDEPKSDFKANLGARLREAATVEGGWDMLYIGHSPHEEDVLNPTPKLSEPGHAVWTVGYVLRRSGALKLLAAEGLRNIAGLDEYLTVFRGTPVKSEWCHGRRDEWFEHMPGANELEFRGLACHPPLVMPFYGFTCFSDTCMMRKQTRYLRDLPTGNAPCVLEDPMIEAMWRREPPPKPPTSKDEA